jgi:ankyrin repeat protein
VGVDPNAKDSSDNHAMHYAAAYGWVECLKVLVKAGAEPDAQNMWKVLTTNKQILRKVNCS